MYSCYLYCRKLRKDHKKRINVLKRISNRHVRNRNSWFTQIVMNEDPDIDAHVQSSMFQQVNACNEICDVRRHAAPVIHELSRLSAARRLFIYRPTYKSPTYHAAAMQRRDAMWSLARRGEARRGETRQSDVTRSVAKRGGTARRATTFSY